MPKRRSLFASYDKYVDKDRVVGALVTKLSVTSVVLAYIDTLPDLLVHARQADDPWSTFAQDMRFIVLHSLLHKVMCVPATSAPVERIFSDGGLFMRPHRARLGQKLLTELVFTKCNKHVK